MKKIVTALAVFAALVVCSCGPATNSVTIKNDCGFPIKAAVTQSSSTPSSYSTISAGDRATFSGLEDGNYYPHAAKTESGSQDFHGPSLRVYKDESWTISHDGSNFSVSYPVQ